MHELPGIKMQASIEILEEGKKQTLQISNNFSDDCSFISNPNLDENFRCLFLKLLI